MPRFPCSASLLLFVMVGATTCLQAQQAPLTELQDKKKVEISGTLQLKHRGYSTYLVIETSRNYLAVFDANDRRQIREIGLYMSGQSGALKQHLGERIKAEGTLMLEPVSPYYYNGVAIQAATVDLPSGMTLSALEDRSPLVLPPSIQQYYAQVTFLPRSGTFTYMAWDANWQPIKPTGGHLACSLNGSGELLNCYCGADGFEVSKTGSLQDGRFSEIGPPTPFIDDEHPHPTFAQFPLPERIQQRIQRTVLCTHIREKK